MLLSLSKENQSINQKEKKLRRSACPKYGIWSGSMISTCLEVWWGST